MSPETIAERASAIRLPVKALGKMAGKAENTVNRTLSRKTRPLQETVDLLVDALTAEEIRLRDYLLTLHPLPVRREGEAA